MSEVSDVWIKLNYWFLNNRRDLTHWWVIVLLGIDLILIAFVVINGFAVAITYTRTNEWITEIGSSRIVGTESQQRNSPNPFKVSSVETVTDSLGQTIFLGIFSNENSFWSAKKVLYKFTTSAGETDVRETTVPSATDRVVLLSSETKEKATSTSLIFDSVDWERTPNGTIPDVSFNFTDPTHRFITVQGTSGPQAVSQIATTMTNDSLYDIKNIKIIVVIRNGTKLVSARQFFVEKVASHETRDLKFQFSETLGQFTNILLYPEVDVFHENNLAI